MSIKVIKVGQEATPVLVIDRFVADPDGLVDIAEKCAPFPHVSGHFYPGLRRKFEADDYEAVAYVNSVCNALAPALERIYGVRTFKVGEASFSLVTTPPDQLHPLQSVPHFDTVDASVFALVHYLFRAPFGGTGFYRHDRSGFELLTKDRLPAFTDARGMDLADQGLPIGYHSGSRNGFSEIGAVEGLYNRAVLYPGCLLHSGLVNETQALSARPKSGRLTANVFLHAFS